VGPSDHDLAQRILVQRPNSRAASRPVARTLPQRPRSPAGRGKTRGLARALHLFRVSR